MESEIRSLFYKHLIYMVKGLFVKILRPFVFICHVEAEAMAAQKLESTTFNAKAELYEAQWGTYLAKPKT